jgi:hypothetical protein
MIIWLASYPRSGNTLLRTICKRCLGICSYADEPVNYESEFRSNPDLIGHVEYEGAWEDFYQFASGSSDIFLVKTHRLPVDRQPFIYIVRDGRQSIRSYQRFMKHYNKMDVSLVKLILGVDAYGGWSDHYEKWNHRDVRQRLILKFEDLANLTDDTVARIAAFIKFSGDPRPWQNPVDHLKTIEPNFFNFPKTDTADVEFWSASHEYLFVKIHGRLMRELGFDPLPCAPKDQVECPDHMKKMIDDVTDIVNELFKERLSLLETCDQRLALINKLHGVCEERLNLIEKLNNAIHQT